MRPPKAIVVVPGLGSGPWDWEAVIALSPPEPPVLFMDVTTPSGRPGRDERWLPAAVAGRLRDGLRELPAAGAGPVLLVGHSSGALAVQAFAYLHPDECAGLLLVDGSHELAPRVRPGWVRRIGRFLAGVLVETGLVSLAAPAVRRIGVRTMSVRGRDPLTAGERRRHYRPRVAARRMADGWVGHASLQAGLVRWHSHGAPEVPVRVVAGTARVGRRGTDRRWSAVQRDLAVRMGDPAPVLLADAAHLVPLDRPDAVVHAIGRLLRAGAAGEAAGQSSGEHLEAR